MSRSRHDVYPVSYGSVVLMSYWMQHRHQRYCSSLFSLHQTYYPRTPDNGRGTQMRGRRKRPKMSANFWPFSTINVRKKSRFRAFRTPKRPKFTLLGRFGARLVSHPGAKISGHAPPESLPRFVREKKHGWGRFWALFVRKKCSMRGPEGPILSETMTWVPLPLSGVLLSPVRSASACA